MKKVIPMLMLLLAFLISCSSEPKTDKKLATANVSITATTVSSRTIAPEKITEPTYYIATLTNDDNTYTAESGSGSLAFNNVYVGDYTVEVKGYNQKGGQVIFKSSGTDKLSVTVKGTNTCSVQMYLINNEGTGTIKINLDWSVATETEGIIKDMYANHAFRFELIKVDDSGNTTSLSTKTATVGATSYIYEDTLAVSNGFTGYFNIYYTEGENEFLLMRTASSSFQIYAGQESVPDDNDTAIYTITAENMPEYFNTLNFSLDYGDTEKETSIKVLWDDNNGYYTSVVISCNNGQTVTVDASTKSYTFTGLDKATEYTFSLYGKSKLGKQTQTLTKSLATKVFVTGVSFDESVIPSDAVVSGSEFSIAAVVSPSNATIKTVTWTTSDNDVLEPIPTTSESAPTFYAKKPGVVNITVTAVDKDINGNEVSYTSTKQVSVKLETPKAPEVFVENNEISKEIVIAWPEVGYATGYRLYKNGELFQTLTESEYTDAALMAGTAYSYSVEATYNAIKTDSFDPTSSMSASSESLTPVVPTITLVQPTIDRLALQINEGEEIAKGAITVASGKSVTLNIPSAIEGAVEYAWFVNGTLKKSSSNFETINAITLTSDMAEVQDYEKDSNSIMLRVKDSNGNYHSASAYFRVIQVLDTGVSISMNDYYSTSNGTIQFNASVLPANATMQTLTYSSDNDDVATIDSTGNITIKKYGTVTFAASSASGIESKKTIRFYDDLTDAKTLLNIVVSDMNVALTNANSEFGGDWWTSGGKSYSKDGYAIASSKKASQTNGEIKISERTFDNTEYGVFVLNTSTSISLNAKDGGNWAESGYLGDDPLQYVGADNKGLVNVTLPYNQGQATIQFNSVKVCDGRSGSFSVKMPGKSAQTFEYSDTSINALL